MNEPTKERDELAGMTPWEFACRWYHPEEIAWSIARSKNAFPFEEINRIPTDVYSQEFAEWLTDQYRLAMRKGIEIGQRSSGTRFTAELAAVKRERDGLMVRVTELEGAIREIAAGRPIPALASEYYRGLSDGWCEAIDMARAALAPTAQEPTSPEAADA